jgi:hypothetical protein
MFSRLKSAPLPAFALLGLFLVGCDPKPGIVLYQPYHDPFDTAAPAGFSEIPTGEVAALGQILIRAKPRARNADDGTYSPNFQPFGTISRDGKDGQKESCICHDHRIECDGDREFDVADKDVPAYRELMKRIDSLDHARRGVEKRSAPPISIPDVPVK